MGESGYMIGSAAAGLALSHVHNCTRPGEQAEKFPGDGVPAAAEAASSPGDGERPERGKAVVFTVWRGGSLVEAEAVESDETGTGKVARKLGERERVKGGRRGKVAGFSVASRRRLLKLFARLRGDALPLFVTLTLPDGVAHDGHSLKGVYLRRFKARLARKFPKAAFIWRMEVKRRKSGAQVGEAVPHLHLILWGVPMSTSLKTWLWDSWAACVGARSRVDLQAARNSRQVKAYASKLYAAKSQDDGQIDEQGRSWGILAEALLPWAVKVIRLLSPAEAAQALRIVRRYFQAAVRGRRRRRGKVRAVIRWVFVDCSERWADLLESGAFGGLAG